MQLLNNTKVLTIKVWREAYNKCLQTLKAEKSPTKSKASLFSDLGTLIWSWARLRQNQNPSYIPTFVIYDNTKFGNDPSTQDDEGTYRIKEISPKEENMLKIGLFRAKNFHLVNFVFFYFSDVWIIFT